MITFFLVLVVFSVCYLIGYAGKNIHKQYGKHREWTLEELNELSRKIMEDKKARDRKWFEEIGWTEEQLKEYDEKWKRAGW